jgi:hypothetical protein
LDLAAQRRLRNVQTFCGVGKMQFLRDGDEAFELPKRWPIHAIKVSIVVNKSNFATPKIRQRNL